MKWDGYIEKPCSLPDMHQQAVIELIKVILNPNWSPRTNFGIGQISVRLVFIWQPVWQFGNNLAVWVVSWRLINGLNLWSASQTIGWIFGMPEILVSSSTVKWSNFPPGCCQNMLQTTVSFYIIGVVFFVPWYKMEFHCGPYCLHLPAICGSTLFFFLLPMH